MGKYTRQEIDDAFRHFQEAADQSAKSKDWRAWSECFTEDASYFEHHYGKMQGRQAIYEWIQKTMTEPVVEHMDNFPIDWYVIDEERGWVLCSVWNEMHDPGDGSLHRTYNWTMLHYAGDGLFSYEEDVYNPQLFAEMIKGWLEAKKAVGQN
jgi:hypothetical protein